jgi:polyisoprenoid-binding protein YceI
MKPVIGIIIAIIVIGAGWYYFSSPTSEENVTQNEENAMMQEDGTEPSQGTYTVKAEESDVEWSASKPLISGYTHHGTITVSAGTIVIGDETGSGSFTLDMNGLKVTSLGGGKAGRESQLEGHLKTGDFFDVEKYPTASFEITSVVRTETVGMYTVTGDLTIKNVTEAVTFPAQIYEKDGMLYANADFAIDRTRWGITFGSANFFEGLAENAIGDEITLSLNLVATKEGAMMEEEN